MGFIVVPYGAYLKGNNYLLSCQKLVFTFSDPVDLTLLFDMDLNEAEGEVRYLLPIAHSHTYSIP